MRKSFAALREEWNYIRGLTRTFVRKINDEELDKKLPRKNLDTIRKQCEELIEVQACYLNALETGKIEFDGYSDEKLPGTTGKKKLLARFEELDSLLENKLSEVSENKTIDWFGEKKTIFNHLMAMVSHESMHVGQIVAFCYSQGIDIPEEVTKIMALSG